jgi:transposase
MNFIQIVLPRQTRRRLLRAARKTHDAAGRVRYMIVIHSVQGKSQRQIADALGCDVSTVKRVRGRWRECGEAGLIDRREDNATQAKVDAFYVAQLLRVLEHSPQSYGHRRPTWTLEVMIAVMAEQGFERVSRTTMSRLLKKLGVRHGRPKPTVACPWNPQARRRRIRMIRTLIDTLPGDEAAVWEDEVDIHLNPKIGPDWMLPSTQRRVRTPGKNVKRYIAGAMDARTDNLAWVSGEKKNSRLFIALLRKLLRVYADRKVIHVILDNYAIHTSVQTRVFLAEHGDRLRLHFLPPYCPDDNRIERRVWRELHANVTRNHRCGDIEELMEEVVYHLMHRNRTAKQTWRRCA